jgi:hypothetical protein
MMQLRTKPNNRKRRHSHARSTRAAIDLKPIRIEISDEEILADLLYPAPADSVARRR